MVSAHPNATLDSPRQPPKLGDFFSPYQQQPPPIFDNTSNINNGYENLQQFNGSHRPQSVTNLPLRQQNSNSNINNHSVLARQSQQNRRSPLMNTSNNNSQQYGNPLGQQRPQPLMNSPTAMSPQEILQNRVNSANSLPKNPKLYKTELCRSWMDHGRCNYGERCQYAHGENEKRPIPRHPKYKTEACSSYHKTGYCPYGPRCHFIHNEEPAVLRQLIAQNAAAMATVGPEEGSPTSLTPTTPRPRNLNLHQTMSAPPSTAATPMQQFSGILPIGSRPQQQSSQQPMQHYGQKQLGSDGESPIPSSTDSGSESPLGSFSPGLDIDESPNNVFHRSISQSATRWSPTQGMMPSFTSSASAAVASSTSTGLYSSPDPWGSIESSLIPSLSNMSFGGDSTTVDHSWDGSKIMSTSPSRLPVFERLSNNF